MDLIMDFYNSVTFTINIYNVRKTHDICFLQNMKEKIYKMYEMKKEIFWIQFRL